MPEGPFQPDIYVGKLRIMEPVIALTGLLMCALCVYALYRLPPMDTGSVPGQMIVWFFILMALSTATGAIFGHAFYYKAGMAGKFICWILSLLSMTALAQAAIEHARPMFSAGMMQFLSLANVAGLIGALALLFLYKKYHGMAVHSAYTLLLLMMPLETYIYWHTGDPASLYLLWSVLPAMLSALPLVAHWSPGVWFTDFDVAHILLLPTLWMIMLAGEQL